MRRRNFGMAVALGMLPFVVRAEPAPDPAAKVDCLPSRECALELARVYAVHAARQDGDANPVVAAVSRLASRMIDFRDPAAPGAVDQFVASVRTSKNPKDEDLRTVAYLQAAIGRRDAALATIREIRDEREARGTVEDVSRRAIKENRIDDARAFLQTLRADWREAVSVGLVYERWHAEDSPDAKALVAAFQLDLAKMPDLSFRMILAEDGDTRFDRALALLKSLSRKDATFTAGVLWISQGASPAALPLLRYARELYDADLDMFGLACKTLAVHFAEAGAAADADAIASTCKPPFAGDDFRKEMVTAHAHAGNYDAANHAAARITHMSKRADALGSIAKAKVLIGKQSIEAAFADVRDASVEAERLLEIAADQREKKRNADALATLRLAARAARRETDLDSRSRWLSQAGEEMARLGAYAEANELLPQIPRSQSRLRLLCAVGVGAAKAQDRRRAVATFDTAHDIAAKEEMDSKTVQLIIEWQAFAGLTQEALAAARRMPQLDGQDDSPRQWAFEAVIVAMAKQGDLAQAFALGRTQERLRALIFETIYEVLAGPPEPAD